MEINHHTTTLADYRPDQEQVSESHFIEANTTQVTLNHLQKDCIVPVFSKDNETTISHHQFIDTVLNTIKTCYPELSAEEPRIRVSHTIKGRIPAAIGKPLKEVLEHEKTLYYERCAFLIELKGTTRECNGNMLSLTVGGVRAYNQENLYNTKSLEKFKVFIGYRNRVCTNLCISTDGLAGELKASSLSHLGDQIGMLFSDYRPEIHLNHLEQLTHDTLTEEQFAHLVGRLRMYHHLNKQLQQRVYPFMLTDSQVNQLVHGYYHCTDFGRQEDGSINLWYLYNLLTEANKSSYIDKFLERGLNAYEFVQELSFSLRSGAENWYVNN